MFSTLFKISGNSRRSPKWFTVSLAMLMLVALGSGLSGCDSEPPKLMKAVKQFKTDKELEEHMSHIRKDHMELLRHKRDKTMYLGIRTKTNSLKACINCHVPEQHNGKILRHTDPEHFCATCHNYVSADPDCFQCHVDHPVKQDVAKHSETDSFTHKPEVATFNTVESQASEKSVALADVSTKSAESEVVTGETSSE